MVTECSAGNADAARRRLDAIQDLPELEISEQVETLAAKHWKQQPCHKRRSWMLYIMMNNDPIVEEVHKIREAHAEKFDNEPT